MRLWILVSLLATVGCRQLLGLDQASSPTADAPPADPDGPPPESLVACAGAPTGLLGTLCFMPTGAVELSSTINTDTDAACEPTRADSCIVAGTSITITTPVRAQGTRPLVLWSASTITLGTAGVIDVSSKFGSIPGAGANAASCLPADGPGTSVGAGGAGGAYASAGGSGGGGRSDIAGTMVQNQNPSVPLPVGFRGGCRGGNGGLSVGSGGSSGGVIYMLAVGNITISGTIVASGAGGLGAAVLGGGGGGGSGGLIGLDAPEVVIDAAQIAALGGAGGSGGASGSSGARGNDADAAAPFVAAVGGGNTVNNNGGGAGGGIGGNLGGSGGNIVFAAVGGGGGGGGGAGYVMVFGNLSDDNPSQIEPPLVLN